MHIEWVPIEDVIDDTGQKIMIATCAVLSIFFVWLIWAVLTGVIVPPSDDAVVDCTRTATTTHCVIDR